MKAALVVLVLLASATIAARLQPQFKAGVEVVYLDVTVQAPDGSIVRGLTKDDFLIYDEDVLQDVAVFSAEPAPISVAVLIDTSGSMTGERMAAAIRAADALGRSLQPNDLWSISTFDSTRRTMIGWRPYNASIVNSLRAMPTSGSTELFKSVADMVPFMKDTPHRKRAMLLMTDGIDNSIVAASREGARRSIRGAGAARGLRQGRGGASLRRSAALRARHQRGTAIRISARAVAATTRRTDRRGRHDCVNRPRSGVGGAASRRRTASAIHAGVLSAERRGATLPPRASHDETSGLPGSHRAGYLRARPK